MDGSMRKKKWFGWTGALIVVLVPGVFVASCSPTSTRPRIVLECPDHDFTTHPGVPHMPESDTVPLAGPITNIPEFHDCQRFLDPNGNRYLALVGIWVSAKLDSLGDRLERESYRINWPIPGGGTVNPDNPFDPRNWRRSPPGSRPYGVAFAEIFSYDAAYSPLGIRKGWNCLYLYRTQDANQYGAVLTPVDSGRACLHDLTPENAAALVEQVTPLFVRRTDGLRDADYPPVGRWEWDTRYHRQYIGIKCGSGWCEIAADREFSSSPGYAPDFASLAAAGASPASAELTRVYSVKGWYDEQQLGVSPAATTAGGIVPASFRGIAVPEPVIDTISTAATFDTFVVVAHVALDKGGEAVYGGKFNFQDATMPPNGPIATLTEVALCTGTRGSCLPRGSELKCGNGSIADKALAETTRWFFRVKAPGGRTEYRCGERHGHEQLTALGIHVPGTARWRWLAKDEKLWVRCVQGCCTVN
jgi:hypothetical protein